MQRKNKGTQKHDIAKKERGGLKEKTTQRKKMLTRNYAHEEKDDTKTFRLNRFCFCKSLSDSRFIILYLK